MIIHYIAPPTFEIEQLLNASPVSTVQLLPFDMDVEKLTNLLIVSPIKSDHRHTCPEKVWKRYLNYHVPKVKLIIAGFQSGQQTNHIDLFNPPNTLERFVHNAQPVSATWEMVKLNGIDLYQKLKQFYKGHGEESVIDKLAKIKRKFDILYTEVNEYQGAFEEVSLEVLDSNYIDEKWRIFKSRWSNYLSLFISLPFYEVLLQADEIINRINPFFESKDKSEKLFTDLKCWKAIHNIYQKLSTIEERYVK